MGTVTIGVSIAVPEPHGSLLQERRAGFGDAAAHGIPTHVTLLPPTEVDAAALPAIEAHLAEVAAAGRPFPMRLSGTGTFRPAVAGGLRPGRRGRRRPAPGSRSRSGTPSGPVARELQFPYHPHVTVAHGIDEEAMDRAFEELADYEAAVALHRLRALRAGRRRGVAQAARVPLRRRRRAPAGRPAWTATPWPAPVGPSHQRL